MMVFPFPSFCLLCSPRLCMTGSPSVVWDLSDTPPIAALDQGCLTQFHSGSYLHNGCLAAVGLYIDYIVGPVNVLQVGLEK